MDVEGHGGVLRATFEDEVDERRHEAVDGGGVDPFGVDPWAAHECEVGPIYDGVGVDEVCCCL